jgi:glycine/D-amino acid oxidase-like deaminating enzyme
LGYGGNGITFSWVAANLLLDRFLERPNPAWICSDWTD